MSGFPFPVLFYLFVREFFLKRDLTLLRKSLLHLTLSQQNSVSKSINSNCTKVYVGEIDCEVMHYL